MLRKSATAPKTPLMSFLSQGAKNSVVNSNTPLPKKTGIIESLRNSVKSGLTMPTRVQGESSMAYAQKLMGRQEAPAQWKTGMKETLSPNIVKQNVSKSIQGKQLFGQTQPITGRTVPDNDFATNASKLAKFFLPRSQKEITTQEVEKGGTPGQISDRIARASMEEGIANVVGMGGIKAVGGAAKQSISKLKPLIEEAKKYKTTVNIQDKNDIEYLKRIFSDDTIADIKAGKKTNWRGENYSDVAKVNIISETPKTIEQQLSGKIKDIKLKNDTFYHGTSAENSKGIMSSGFKTGGELPESNFRGGGYGKMQNSISFAETPKEASIFSKLTRDGKIVEAKLKPNSKVVSIQGVEDAIDLEDYITYLRKQKIDAVYIGGGEKELVVINPKAVAPTKSQLTDIWNEANKKSNFGLSIEENTQFTKTAKTSQKTTAQNALRGVKNGKVTKTISDLDAKKINKAFPNTSVKAGESSVDVLKKIQSAESKKEIYNNPATRNKALHDLLYEPKIKAVSNLTENETSQAIKQVKGEGQRLAEVRQPFSKDTTIKGLARNTERATPKQLPRKLSARDEEFLNTPYNKNRIKDVANIVEDMNTPVNKKVNLLDYARTPNRVLNKIGLGKEADLLRTQYDKYAKELPKNIDKITQWSKEVPKESNQKIFQYLDGQDVPLTVKETKVAGEIKTWLSEWADRLQLPKDNRISNYITHIFDQQLVKKEFDEDLAKIIAERVPGSVYDPFLLQRLGKLGYKEDTWAALDAYVKRATRKANLDSALEQIGKKAGSLEESQWNYVKRYVDNVNMRPSNIDNLADNLIKSSPIEYKLGQRPTTNVLRKFRQATYRGMLGLNPTSAMRNLSQGANTYAKIGEKYTMLGYSKLLSPSARKEVAESGVLKNDFIQDRALSSTKKAVEKLDKGLFYMFETAEKINRGAAYWGAKSKALSQGKSESQAIDIAKKMVRDTQFAFDSIDTPVAMQGDIAKTLLQFQSYTTKQSEFLLEMYKNKEFAGLFRYSVSGLAFVYTLGTAFGMEPKELIPAYRFDTPPSMKLPVEVGKALLNSPDKYGNERNVSEKLSDISKAGIGLIPAGSQMKKSYQGYSAIKDGASTTKSGTKQFDVGGTPAKDAQALLFGKYANKEAKDYFDGTSYSESKMSKEERTINDLLDKKEILKDKDTQKFKESLKEGIKNGTIKQEDGLKYFKKLMNSQTKIKAQQVFDKLEKSTPEEKKAAVKDLTPEEIKALIKIIKDKAKE
jgi:hypothetical protein